jgi:hypothetical protein
MKFSIDTKTTVDGTPVGKNIPLPPTDAKLDGVWNTLRHTVKELGKAVDMVEVLKASFHQYGTGTERYHMACFKAVLVVPDTCPARKTKAEFIIEANFLVEEADRAADKFAESIRAEIRRALSMAEESVRTMSAML